MSGKKIALISLVIVGALTTGCVSVPQSTASQQKHEYSLNQQCPTDLTVAVGETIKFVADENMSTGYSWKLLGAVQHLEATTSYLSNKTEGYLVVGVGGVRSFYFKATSVGTDTIKLAYNRGWEAQSPAAQWTCQVTIK